MEGGVSLKRDGRKAVGATSSRSGKEWNKEVEKQGSKNASSIGERLGHAVLHKSAIIITVKGLGRGPKQKQLALNLAICPDVNVCIARN